MRVAFHDADGKGALIAEALVAAGHTLDPHDGQVAVVDHTHTNGLLFDRPTVLYPHGGNPCLDWDGHLPHHPNVKAHLTHGPGQAQVLEAVGVAAPAVPVGWCYSEVAAPRFPTEVRLVVFAAPHRLSTGYLDPILADASDSALAALRAAGMEVTVRTMEDGLGLSHDDIDAADLVVADWGTVAHLALARGCPLIMMGTRGGAPDIGHTGPVHPVGWDRYRHLCRYPVDMADGPLDQLVERVCRPDFMVEMYRCRMVGGAFSPARVVAVVESVAAGLPVESVACPAPTSSATPGSGTTPVRSPAPSSPGWC